MKRALLASLGLVALLATAAASAAPVTFTFNTSGFDFTNYEIDAGYLGFAMNGNQLQVNLSSAGPVSSIPAINLWVPGPTTNAFGADVYPTLGNITDIKTYSYGDKTDGFSVTHDNVSLSTVVDAYVQNLGKLGFTATMQASSTPNVVVYTFNKNGAQLKGVFHREGANVNAYLTGATS